MTSHRWKGWHPQQPSAQFTERTVAALVRDRRRRRDVWGPQWALVAATAAILMAGAAFASLSLRRGAPTIPVAPLSAEAPLPTAVPNGSPSTELVEPDPSPPPPTAASAPRPTRRKVEAPPPAANAPDAGHKVILPRCNCSPNEATICDCF